MHPCGLICPCKPPGSHAGPSAQANPKRPCRPICPCKPHAAMRALVSSVSHCTSSAVRTYLFVNVRKRTPERQVHVTLAPPAPHAMQCVHAWKLYGTQARGKQRHNCCPDLIGDPTSQTVRPATAPLGTGSEWWSRDPEERAWAGASMSMDRVLQAWRTNEGCSNTASDRLGLPRVA